MHVANPRLNAGKSMTPYIEEIATTEMAVQKKMARPSVKANVGCGTDTSRAVDASDDAFEAMGMKPNENALANLQNECKQPKAPATCPLLNVIT